MFKECSRWSKPIFCESCGEATSIATQTQRYCIKCDKLVELTEEQKKMVQEFMTKTGSKLPLVFDATEKARVIDFNNKLKKRFKVCCCKEVEVPSQPNPVQASERTQ